jgi:hypothetical protein
MLYRQIENKCAVVLGFEMHQIRSLYRDSGRFITKKCPNFDPTTYKYRYDVILLITCRSKK